MDGRIKIKGTERGSQHAPSPTQPPPAQGQAYYRAAVFPQAQISEQAATAASTTQIQQSQQPQSQANRGKIRLGGTSRFRRRNEPAFALPEKVAERASGPTIMGMEYGTALKSSVGMHAFQGAILLIIGMRFLFTPAPSATGMFGQMLVFCYGNMWLVCIAWSLVCFACAGAIWLNVLRNYNQGNYAEAGKAARKLSVLGALSGLVLSGMILTSFYMSVTELEAERKHAAEQTLDHSSLAELQQGTRR